MSVLHEPTLALLVAGLRKDWGECSRRGSLAPVVCVDVVDRLDNYESLYSQLIGQSILPL